jgi:hypothetical protein
MRGAKGARMRGRTIAGGVALGALLLARGARAAEDFVWTAPEGCPSQADVARDVMRVRGEPAEASRRRAVATVSRGKTGAWNVRIETVSEAGTDVRSLEGESCRALADATALFLALALDPARSAHEAAPAAPLRVLPEPIVDAPPHAPLAHDRVDAAPPSAPRIERKLPRLSLGVSPRTDSATLPSVAFGAEIAAAWRPRPWRFEIAYTDWAGQSAPIIDRPAVGARFSMMSAALRGCYEREIASFTLGPCVAAEADHVRGEGYGELRAASGATYWIAGQIGGSAAWSFTRWGALRLRVDALAPLTRPRFVVEGAEGNARAAAFSVRAGIGVELTIP